MVQTNPDACIHIHQRVIVATVSCSPKAGSTKINVTQKFKIFFGEE